MLRNWLDELGTKFDFIFIEDDDHEGQNFACLRLMAFLDWIACLQIAYINFVSEHDHMILPPMQLQTLGDFCRIKRDDDIIWQAELVRIHDWWKIHGFLGGKRVVYLLVCVNLMIGSEI